MADWENPFLKRGSHLSPGWIDERAFVRSDPVDSFGAKLEPTPGYNRVLKMINDGASKAFIYKAIQTVYVHGGVSSEDAMKLARTSRFTHEEMMRLVKSLSESSHGRPDKPWMPLDKPLSREEKVELIPSEEYKAMGADGSLADKLARRMEADAKKKLYTTPIEMTGDGKFKTPPPRMYELDPDEFAEPYRDGPLSPRVIASHPYEPAALNEMTVPTGMMIAILTAMGGSIVLDMADLAAVEAGDRVVIAQNENGQFVIKKQKVGP